MPLEKNKFTSTFYHHNHQDNSVSTSIEVWPWLMFQVRH